MTDGGVRTSLRIALAAATVAGVVVSGASGRREAPAQPQITQITTGWRHTCAITSAGRVKCWGSNGFGQLGDGSRNSRRFPVDVVGLSGVTAITAGINHTCALTRGGAVKCWGNLRGSLREPLPKEDGAITRPVGISGVGSGAIQIAAGGYNTCALMSAGPVRCWGRGSSIASRVDPATSRTSVPVRGLPGGLRAIGGGVPHCAVTSSGGITCWGLSNDGPAGGRGSQAGPFTAVTGGETFFGVDGSSASSDFSHLCALTTGGGVKCWGLGGSGQLGNGTSTDSAAPVDVSGLPSGVAAVEAGRVYTCAVTGAGGVKCWGGGHHGNLGNRTTVLAQPTPVDVTGLGSGVKAISASGDGHTCALTNAGRVKCWGDGRGGQLGNGKMRITTTPVDVVFSRG